MNHWMVLAVHESGWYDTPNDEENEATGTGMLARVRMFFRKDDPNDPEYEIEYSYDEDFKLPDHIIAHGETELATKLVSIMVPKRMEEIAKDGSNTISQLVPDQKERVHNEHVRIHKRTRKEEAIA